MKQLFQTRGYMTPEKLLDASETLTWLSERLNGFGPDVRKSTMQAGACLIANSTCVQLAYHMQKGLELNAALEQVVLNVDTQLKFDGT